MLKILRDFPGAKTARNRFLLSQGKLCFAKIVLGAAKLPLRIEIGGAAAPPSHPGMQQCNFPFLKKTQPSRLGKAARFSC